MGQLEQGLISGKRVVKFDRARFEIFRLKRTHFWGLIFAILGMILGYFWLIPAYNEPLYQSHREDIESLRMFRLLAPMIVSFSGAAVFGVKRRFIFLDLLVVILFFALPQLVLAIYGFDPISELVIGVPLLVSGVCLLSFSLWPEDKLRGLLVGIGIVSAGLIAWRVAHYGIEINTYYWRPRMHLGFDHPIVTGSAMFATVLSAVLLLENIPHHRLKLTLIVATIGMSLFAFKSIDSRNIIVFTLLILVASIARFYVPNNLWWKLLSTLLAFGLIMGMVLLGLGGNASRFTDIYTSEGGRLHSLFLTVEQMMVRTSALYGYPNINTDSFALTDSIFTTYWVRFGIIGLWLFILFFVVLGKRILMVKPSSTISYLAFSGYWALIAFYLLDAQGLTSANLAVFMVFVCAYRMATQCSVD